MLLATISSLSVFASMHVVHSFKLGWGLHTAKLTPICSCIQHVSKLADRRRPAPHAAVHLTPPGTVVIVPLCVNPMALTGLAAHYLVMLGKANIWLQPLQHQPPGHFMGPTGAPRASSRLLGRPQCVCDSLSLLVAKAAEIGLARPLQR